MPLNLTTTGRTRQGGQSLIEYLILVALMGVATIGIIRTLQGALNSRYASVIHSLQAPVSAQKSYRSMNQI
ncbi:MAG: hypothetical protein IPJ71_16880 [Bdellovibrionales bacterium]|nr:hypothetical protein [Bdellovibrionales bacterium]